MTILRNLFCGLFAASTLLFATAEPEAGGQHRAQSRPSGALTEGQVNRVTMPSIVDVFSLEKGGWLSQGKGFFVREDLVATNYHVVKNASRVYCKTVGGEDEDDSAYSMVGVAYDEEWDLALLQVSRLRRRPLRISATTAAVGQVIYALGSSAEGEARYFKGLVRHVGPGGAFARSLEVNVSMQEDASGSPILNGAGLVTAIARLGNGDETGNAAIPASYLKVLIASVDCHREFTEGGVPGGPPEEFHWSLGQRTPCRAPLEILPPSSMRPPPPPDAAPTPVPRIIRSTGNVLQGSAIRQVEPAYPALAKAAGVTGSVVVEILIDERGNVISANALSGHPLLKDAAVEAARGWKFNPTRVEGVA